MNKKLERVAMLVINNGNKVDFKFTKDKQESLIVNFCKKQTMSCFVVKDDKVKKVATLTYLINKKNKSVFVEKLEIIKDYQFISIGSNMLECLQNYSRNLGLKKMELISLEPSVKFYQKLGFDEVVIAEDFVYSCNIEL